jgi:hypothetical protein
MDSTSRDRREDDADGAHPQEKAAEELSNRAAESVEQRYDGTKESYEHAPEQVDPGDGED